MTATIAIIVIRIDLTGINLVIATIALEVVTTITEMTIRIPEILALFARNRTVVLRSIHRRNKRQKGSI